MVSFCQLGCTFYGVSTHPFLYKGWQPAYSHIGNIQRLYLCKTNAFFKMRSCDSLFRYCCITKASTTPLHLFQKYFFYTYGNSISQVSRRILILIEIAWEIIAKVEALSIVPANFLLSWLRDYSFSLKLQFSSDPTLM